MDPTGGDWEAVLDAMEARLERAEFAIAGEPVGATAFTLPEGIGALPHHLAPRAERILERTRRAERDAEAARARVVALLRERTPVPGDHAAYGPGGGDPPAYVDTRV